MKETEKLYYKNGKETEFSAIILEQNTDENGLFVILDRTLFYPEGGGQPADKGYLNNVLVKNVIKKDGMIYHYISEEIKNPKIKGIIDWEHRLDYMQQHTGQHLISAAFWKLRKYKTVSVHLSKDYTTVEVQTGTISDEELKEIEVLVNDKILENLSINYIITNDRELKNYDIRKPTLLKGEIRLVNVQGFDCVACGGIHLSNIGEVRLAKVFKKEKIRGNVRTYWKIGNRALSDYERKTVLTDKLRRLLNSEENEIENKVLQLLSEIKENRYKINRLYEKLIEKYKVNKLSSSIKNEKGIKLIVDVFENEDKDFIINLLKVVISEKSIVICLINKKKALYNWLIGVSDNIKFEFSDVRKDILNPLGLKGGGKNSIWQGVGKGNTYNVLLEELKKNTPGEIRTPNA